LPKEWVRKHRKDYFYRKAKEEDYRSRASFKLAQTVEKYQFIKPSDVVVDLGAAPGGWLQVARKIVGEKGFVLGVDLTEIKPLDYVNVLTIIGDITESETTNQIAAILPREADVVVSDASPKVSGIWEVDHARQIELANASLQIATSMLKSKGNFFVKVFQGEFFNRFLNSVRKSFSETKAIKPKATRKESAEIYVLGLGFKGKSKVADSLEP
jgi:23S rRNA (uridine2552-2'-O)-methyltransferase